MSILLFFLGQHGNVVMIAICLVCCCYLITLRTVQGRSQHLQLLDCTVLPVCQPGCQFLRFMLHCITEYLGKLHWCHGHFMAA